MRAKFEILVPQNGYIIDILLCKNGHKKKEQKDFHVRLLYFDLLYMYTLYIHQLLILLIVNI